MTVTIKDGTRTMLVAEGKLKSVPGTGDTIILDDVLGKVTYLVKSVEHHNVFQDPGEHEIVVNIEKI